jgi:hypothetical protein
VFVTPVTVGAIRAFAGVFDVTTATSSVFAAGVIDGLVTVVMTPAETLVCVTTVAAIAGETPPEMSNATAPPSDERAPASGV